MSERTEIIELSRQSSSDLSRFLQVPYSIYRDDPNWVAPLLGDLKTVFTDANPLFDHAEMKLWVARRDGVDVGRIAGIIDRNHNTFHNERTGFFGFFESIDDSAVAVALTDAAAAWARNEGMIKLIGPMNPTTNDECGLLVEGFDRPPVFMMTYNPPFYLALMEAAGFTKAKDLLAYHFHVSAKPIERMNRLAEGVKRREPGLVIQSIRKKTLADDLIKVKEVYNSAWEQNWGFVPMTDEEMEFMARRLKPLLVEELSLIALKDGEPVAFMLSLPDYNEAIQPLKGKLLSPKFFNFLKYVLGWKRPKLARVLTLGIKKQYRQRGIDAVLFAQALSYGLKAGFEECEVSWMLEDNVMVLRPIEVFDGKKYKTYRIYEKAI